VLRAVQKNGLECGFFLTGFFKIIQNSSNFFAFLLMPMQIDDPRAGDKIDKKM